MKIALVVQGRFHAFDLARTLIERGNDVTVFTNYPRWAVRRFGVRGDRVRSFPLHNLLARIAGSFTAKTGLSLDSWTHPLFSRWAARQLSGERWDVIHAWSGVAEEIYENEEFHGSHKLLMRGSAHIRTQAEILAGEEARAGRRMDHPSKWMLAREQREYELSDKIATLSSFAYDSFRKEGIPDSKLCLLRLGTDTNAFRPKSDVINARRARILSGDKLRVLYVGNVSFQKGAADIQEIIRSASDIFQFRLVGNVTHEARHIAATLCDAATFLGKVNQNELPEHYDWADVFIFPTIQDGFAAVLAQAGAAALPILTTTNCAGPDLLREGRTGWILPIRKPGAFLERLRWCDEHRPELAAMVTSAYSTFRSRDWSDVAADFEALFTGAISDSHVPPADNVFSKA